MKNREIARIFDNIADILEIKEENRFRIRAYRKAAQTFQGLAEDAGLLAVEKKLTDLDGIGKDLASKAEEYLKTGRIKFYESLKKTVSKSVLELMDIPGIGPKTAALLADKLKVRSRKDLEKKARAGKIKNIFGIKEKTVDNILRGIEFLEKSAERITLEVASSIAGEFVGRLEALREVKKIEVAGSLRRMKETVRDIDILVTSKKPDKIMKVFTRVPRAGEVLAQGPTKSSLITTDNVQVDLRVVEPSSFGSAILYFTGSKSHNIKLRKLAMSKGLKINEYGIFKIKSRKRLAGAREEDMYKALGLSYISPELREDTGEIEKAAKGKLPRLVEFGDIKGDLHVHSASSDGVMRLEAIASACEEMGYEYMAVTDHSASLGVAGGLKEKELFRNMSKIDKINKKLKKARLLKGAEVDILDDGRLDYRDSVLKELDFVVAALHSGFKQTKEKLTERILRAMGNRYVNVIAHPTGRLIGVRAGYDIDLDKILKKAVGTNTALEINAYPERLDLGDSASRRAKELGVKISIATDTHTRDQFANMRYGVSVARRGWLEKKDVLNTLSLKELLKKIKK